MSLQIRIKKSGKTNFSDSSYKPEKTKQKNPQFLQ